MGFIPIFILIGSFLFVWAGVIFYTFKYYRTRAVGAEDTRKPLLDSALTSLSMADLVTQGRQGTLPAPAWKAEYAYRATRHTYNKLLRQPPYSVFGRIFGYKPLA
jgi:hypothetical protein